MDSGQDSDSKTPSKEPQRRGRTWTERYSGPLRYRKFTDTDATGKQCIFFKFDLDLGNAALVQAVHDVLHELKYLDRESGGKHRSGLTFKNDKLRGRVWKLPNDQTGRTAAQIIDAKLSELAEKNSGEVERVR